ncbi:MAG: RHS repeat-associated core domain-containing protein, partial [Deltaproteobacteria bacterium]
SYSSSVSAPYPEDDYVWLGGRPVAYVRGQITGSWTRTDELTSPPPICSRQGDNLPCGTYFVVTDHIGKPVASLNPSNQIAGLYDYDVFGGMNRQPIQGDTPHPYGPNEGTTTCSTNTNVIADVTQRPAASGLGVDMRERFHYVDCAMGCNPCNYNLCGFRLCPSTNASVGLRNGDTGACLATFQGEHAGATISGWYPATHLQTVFDSNSASNTTYDGASVEAVDYREYQTGATPLSLPLRFPGQYYDPETDLHENWNRFYDPSLGRYLEMEPMLSQQPTYAVRLAKWGYAPPAAYAYASNNPLNFTDPTGNQEAVLPTPLGPMPIPDPGPLLEAAAAACAAAAAAVFTPQKETCRNVGSADPQPGHPLRRCTYNCPSMGTKTIYTEDSSCAPFKDFAK